MQAEDRFILIDFWPMDAVRPAGSVPQGETTR